MYLLDNYFTKFELFIWVDMYNNLSSIFKCLLKITIVIV